MHCALVLTFAAFVGCDCVIISGLLSCLDKCLVGVFVSQLGNIRTIDKRAAKNS